MYSRFIAVDGTREALPQAEQSFSEDEGIDTPPQPPRFTDHSVRQSRARGFTRPYVLGVGSGNGKRTRNLSLENTRYSGLIT